VTLQPRWMPQREGFVEPEVAELNEKTAGLLTGSRSRRPGRLRPCASHSSAIPRGGFRSNYSDWSHSGIYPDHTDRDIGLTGVTVLLWSVFERSCHIFIFRPRIALNLDSRSLRTPQTELPNLSKRGKSELAEKGGKTRQAHASAVGARPDRSRASARSRQRRHESFRVPEDNKKSAGARRAKNNLAAQP
jgi:hypothetical protein